MDLATLEIPPEEAERKLAEYRQAVKEERNAEDDALASAYYAATRGHPLIRLSECFERAGLDADGLPRFAISRATESECWFGTDQGYNGGNPTVTHLLFGNQRYPDDRGALVGKHLIRVPTTLPVPYQRYTRRTMVPLVPPNLRPKRARLDKFHIIWEVEEWRLVPPKDPALLRHVRGDLWSVLAVWDLTELERAVLSERA